MPCEKPRRAYAAAAGGRIKFFTKKDKEYYVQNYTGLLVPCGVCILCRQEQSRQWAIRIVHEARMTQQNSFITLTYDEAHTPEHNVLNDADLISFLRKLRRLYNIKYYAVGEYGDKTLRPHYHICLFGKDFADDRITIKEPPHMLWTSPTLARLWGKGHVAIAPLNTETARYTASYIHKKLRAKQRYVRIEEASGELIAAPAPRAYMSRNLGRSWWDKFHQGVLDHDHVVVSSHPQKPPRAYDRWLGEIDSHQLQELKNKRQEKARTKAKTPEQMRAHARNAHARAGRKRKIV